MAVISILMYKQRHRTPNRTSTAGANYAHIRYIATRPRVMKNENMSHGLFGKMAPGEITEFQDWRDIARQVYANSRKNITMYRSTISFTDEVAAELMLKDQKSWQRYIGNHIMTIAEKNHIKREHLQWACAAHKERGHPHIHVVFWDTSSRVRNPFTPDAIPNAIRKQMIKDTFPDKIRAYGQQKDEAVRDMREITDKMVEDFERHIRRMGGKRYQAIWEAYRQEEELEDGFDFKDKTLNELADQIFRIKSALPPKGRISYQLLPPEVKAQVDELVQYILRETPAVAKLAEEYVKSKLQLAMLYATNEGYLKSMAGKYQKEAEKIIANRVLGAVKMLLRLDGELRSAEYMESRREFYASQMLYGILDMLSAQISGNNDDFFNFGKQHTTELSKEARKELYLKYQDKGYEH